MPPSRCVSIVSLRVAHHVLTRHHTVALASKGQGRPNNPLSLSTQETRLICQTWASAAHSIGHSPDGETQTSSRPKYHNRRGGAARPDSTKITSPSTAISSIDKSTFFRHLKNIEKVCKTVDERMQKRKVQKEWSIKVISETAHLRDEEGPLKVNVNTKTHGEGSRNEDNADMAQVDDNDPFDLPGLGMPVQSADRELQLMELGEEVVPTSQSQERYLLPLGASICAPINGSTAT